MTIDELNNNKYTQRYLCEYLDISTNLFYQWKKVGFHNISLKKAWLLKKLYKLSEKEFVKVFELE